MGSRMLSSATRATWAGSQQVAKPASGDPEACGQGSTGVTKGQNCV